MTGHCSPPASDFIFSLSAAKIESVFHFHQIFSAGYSTRLYMYIDIYNQYSDYRPLNCPTKIIPPRRTFQIILADVRECPFWFRYFPRNVRYGYPRCHNLITASFEFAQQLSLHKAICYRSIEIQFWAKQHRSISKELTVSHLFFHIE